jgi:hypothetical protein
VVKYVLFFVLLNIRKVLSFSKFSSAKILESKDLCYRQIYFFNLYMKLKQRDVQVFQSSTDWRRRRHLCLYTKLTDHLKNQNENKSPFPIRNTKVGERPPPPPAASKERNIVAFSQFQLSQAHAHAAEGGGQFKSMAPLCAWH